MLLISLAATGCSVAFDLKPGIVAVPDGTWSGVTTQNKPVSFTIKGAEVTDLAFEYRLTQAGCETDGADARQPGARLSATPFGSGNFTYSYDSSSTGARVAMNGYFDPATPPKLSVQISLTKAGCPGSVQLSWLGAKQ
jgi:hypothetical protein